MAEPGANGLTGLDFVYVTGPFCALSANPNQSLYTLDFVYLTGPFAANNGVVSGSAAKKRIMYCERYSRRQPLP